MKIIKKESKTLPQLRNNLHTNNCTHILFPAEVGTGGFSEVRDSFSLVPRVHRLIFKGMKNDWIHKRKKNHNIYWYIQEDTKSYYSSFFATHFERTLLFIIFLASCSFFNSTITKGVYKINQCICSFIKQQIGSG